MKPQLQIIHNRFWILVDALGCETRRIFLPDLGLDQSECQKKKEEQRKQKKKKKKNLLDLLKKKKKINKRKKRERK